MWSKNLHVPLNCLHTSFQNQLIIYMCVFTIICYVQITLFHCFVCKPYVNNMLYWLIKTYKNLEIRQCMSSNFMIAFLNCSDYSRYFLISGVIWELVSQFVSKWLLGFLQRLFWISRIISERQTFQKILIFQTMNMIYLPIDFP